MNNAEFSISSKQPVLPAQVWLTLRPELRLRIIQFLAQLASNLISAQAPVIQPNENEEGTNVSHFL